MHSRGLLSPASTINNLLTRLTRYEAERAYYFLVNEEEWNSSYVQDDGEYSRLWRAIADELGIRITRTGYRFPITWNSSPPCTMTDTGS